MKFLNCSILIIFTCFILHALAYGWSPEGYPYHVSGNLNFIDGTNGAIEDGAYLELNAEQGIDLFKINTKSNNIQDAMFNVFVSGNVTLGGEENRDPWNKKVETDAGFKFRISLKNRPPTISWGDISIGGKINHINYLFDNIEDEMRYIGFVSWGLGGDWKR